MKTKKPKQIHTPRRAERVQRVAHEHVLTLPKNGRKGCALCPYVEPRAKLVMPDHMKADRHAKGVPHPNNHSHPQSTANTTIISPTDPSPSAKVEPSTTAETPSALPTEATAQAPLTTEQLQAMNTPALYRLATTKKVRGRSTMTKAQLIEALS